MPWFRQRARPEKQDMNFGRAHLWVKARSRVHEQRGTLGLLLQCSTVSIRFSTTGAGEALPLLSDMVSRV